MRKRWLKLELLTIDEGSDARLCEEGTNVNKLSAVQEQIIDLLAKGLTEARIAEQLAISQDALTDLLSSTCKELQLSDRVELLLYVYSERDSK